MCNACDVVWCAAWCCVVCCVMCCVMLCGAAWCAAVMCCVSPRGAAWSYMMLRGNGMPGWWMMGVEI